VADDFEQICVHLSIPKSYDRVSIGLQPPGPPFVVFDVFWYIMLFTIEFNYDFVAKTNKIANIGSNRLLAAELEAETLSVAEMEPQQTFRVSAVSSELTGEIPFFLRRGIGHRHTSNPCIG